MSVVYSALMGAPLKLYTDFVCPFCFIAEQSTVPRLVGEFDLQLEWCGFELHPGTPRGGRPLSDLFGPVDLPALHDRTRRFARQFGVEGLDPPNRLQSSRRALALAEFARSHGRLEEFRALVFDAHWRKGADLEADEVLRGLAESAQLSGELAVAAADDPAFLDLVDSRQAEARRAGVSGIPTFIIGSQRVVGCQPYEALAAAVRRAAG